MCLLALYRIDERSSNVVETMHNHIMCMYTSQQARWVLRVELQTYSNPSRYSVANSASFQCCDTDGDLDDGECKNQCDNMFEFCLRNSSTKEPDEPCIYGSYTTGVVGGDDLVFSMGQDIDEGVPNPLLFFFEELPMSVRVSELSSLYVT